MLQAAYLGPQCLSCKKRRVKCDSAMPECERCQKDNIKCPGYVKQLKFNHYRPPAKAKGKKNAPARPTSTLKDDEEVETISRYSPMSPLGFPDRDSLILFDAAEYYNACIVPSHVPAHLPFNRQNMSMPSLVMLPDLIRNVMILLVRTAQARQGSNGPASNTELCHYRGRTLKELKTSLSNATADPYGVALSAIMTLMGIEMQNPVFGMEPWIFHMQAARHIINERGGFGECFFTLPYSQSLLINYMVVDIMSSTTCNSLALDPVTTAAQLEYSLVLQTRHQQLAENGHLCPSPLLLAIVHTNILRIRLSQSHVDKPTLQMHSRSFADILSSIESFDAATWAATVSCYGRAQPARADEAPSSIVTLAWNNVALCFQEAALLYLLLSAGPPEVRDINTITMVQHFLSKHTSFLFKLASADPDGAIETQLWKYVVWTVLVSAYVKICWCCNSVGDMKAEIQKLQIWQSSLNAGSLRKVILTLKLVAEKRAVTFGAKWSWDDGFGDRCAFVRQ